MKPLTPELLGKFLELASDRLEGDWVLLGGTLLPALGHNVRVTVDIDVVSLSSERRPSQSLALMKIAEDLGLPVEAINSAAEYFLSKQTDFEKELVVLHAGKKARILRPNAFLYLRLKIERMTESDLIDCLSLLRFERDSLTEEQAAVIRQRLKFEIEKKDSRKKRLTSLLEKLSQE
jgi:hypothetical protein